MTQKFHFGYLSEEIQNTTLKRHMDLCTDHSTIHNSQDMAATCAPADRRVGRADQP